MLLPLKPICERKDIRRDGTSIIYIQYCFSSEKRTLLNTDIAIPPEFWNESKWIISNELPSTYGDAEHLNSEVKRMYRVAEDIVSFAIKNKLDDILAFVKTAFHPQFDIKTLEKEAVVKLSELPKQQVVNDDFFFQFDAYIESKTRKVCKGMLGVYRQIRERLQAFETFRKSPISFDAIDYNFYDDFIEFLTFYYTHKRRSEPLYGLKVNTIGLQLNSFGYSLKTGFAVK